MDIKTALSLANKDVNKKVQLVLDSHGYKDHSVDVKDIFAEFIKNAETFTLKENMPNVWKSDSSLAQGFDALRLFIEVPQIKTHLIASFEQGEYDMLHTKIYDLKKKHQRLAKNRTKSVAEEDGSEEVVVGQQESVSQQEEKDDVTEDESVITECEFTWSAEDINAIILQNDCAMKFIWDLAASEQDPFKKIILQNLHRSIKAIGPLYKQRSFPSSS